MKKLFFASTLMLAICSASHAQRIGWEPVRIDPVSRGSYSGNSGVTLSGSSSNEGYQGSSGSRYQYDLNNGADRGRYSIDLDAQRRDQMRVDVGHDLDRLKGQHGGGYLGD